ncbi:MAG: folate-binding protein, partial [Lysobacterales bacterium]
TDPLALDRWRLADIEAGLPLLAASLAGEFVAQALDLERLDAIRFDKGCYPGQEIAARLHFRGGNKRRLCRLVVAGEMPAPGAAILAADGASIGRVLYSAARDPHHAGMLAVLGLPESHRPALATASGAHVDMN